MKINAALVVVVILGLIGGSIGIYFAFVYEKKPMEEPPELPELFPPVAVIDASATRVVVGANITFNSSGSSDPDGEVIGYAWNFGDGVRNNTNSTDIEHIYINPGNFTVNLTVMDDDSQVSSTTINITVIPEKYMEAQDLILLSRENPLIDANKTILFNKQPFMANFSFNISLQGASPPPDLSANLTITITDPDSLEIYTNAYELTGGKSDEIILSPEDFSKAGDYKIELVCKKGATRVSYSLVITYL